jgi:hypothetical protein
MRTRQGLRQPPNIKREGLISFEKDGAGSILSAFSEGRKQDEKLNRKVRKGFAKFAKETKLLAER